VIFAACGPAGPLLSYDRRVFASDKHSSAMFVLPTQISGEPIRVRKGTELRLVSLYSLRSGRLRPPTVGSQAH
jgi:hypothetical protein